MEKIDIKEKLDEMKKLSEAGKTKAAADVADEIPWRKSHNINVMVRIAKAYELADRLDEAEEILEFAYDRSPVARMVVYELALLNIKKGEFVGIVGRNGSGKSTLLYSISTMDAPTSGTVNLLGHDITTMQEKEISKIRKEEIMVNINFENVKLNCIKNCKITKFAVEEPSLNEIFVETVGEKYEK